jgi:glycerol-3-phosphate acyltransferase PlsX
MGELIMGLIKDKVGNNPLYKLGALMIKPALRQIKKMFDYAEYGGALLLGVNGLVFIGHGRSDARAIRNAVSTAVRAAHSGAATPTFVPTSQQVSEITENIQP